MLALMPDLPPEPDHVRYRRALQRIVTVCQHPGEHALESIKELAERSLADPTPRAADPASLAPESGDLLADVEAALSGLLRGNKAKEDTAVFRKSKASPEECELLDQVEGLLERLHEIRGS